VRRLWDGDDSVTTLTLTELWVFGQNILLALLLVITVNAVNMKLQKDLNIDGFIKPVRGFGDPYWELMSIISNDCFYEHVQLPNGVLYKHETN
jgi:hypothetical protein